MARKLAFDKTLFDELLWIGQQGNALASGALAARVVGQAFTVGGLREHARKREFTDATRAGKEQGLRDAPGAESAAERRDDAFVAKKFGEAHQRLPGPAF